MLMCLESKIYDNDKEELYCRNKGFDILKDKIKIQNNLKRTKLCYHGENCKRGNNCSFAHSKEELTVSNCVFGDHCKFIFKDQNGIQNISKTKICNHKHDGESIIHFYCRTRDTSLFSISYI